MLALVTGGAGFVGSHLCRRLLRDGHRVVCLDNLSTGRRENIEELIGCSNFELIVRDVCDSMSIEADQIFHLACPASPPEYQRQPVATVRTCVQGTLNVFALAVRSGARVLIASTSEVYGDPQIHPQSEDYWGHVNPVGVRSCYDEGKRCAEAIASAYARQYNVDSRIARIFNTYGPGMLADDGRVVSNFIVQCLRGQSLTIHGDGAQTRSFCYIDDLIEGLMRLMVSNERAPVNLGNPDECSILELARLIQCLAGSASELERRPKSADDPARRKPDIARATALLGWRPSVPLEEGLRRTILDFRARLADLEVAPLRRAASIR